MYAIHKRLQADLHQGLRGDLHVNLLGAPLGAASRGARRRPDGRGPEEPPEGGAAAGGPRRHQGRGGLCGPSQRGDLRRSACLDIHNDDKNS